MNQETSEPKCICKWQHADTGTLFFSRIIKADPACPVHSAKPPNERTKETPGR